MEDAKKPTAGGKLRQLVAQSFVTGAVLPISSIRNKPCPCGSGKKVKLCHGRGK